MQICLFYVRPRRTTATKKIYEIDPSVGGGKHFSKMSESQNVLIVLGGQPLSGHCPKILPDMEKGTHGHCPRKFLRIVEIL